MQITIHPVAGLPGSPGDTVNVTGDTITVNNVPYDLSAVPEGGQGVPQGEHPFAGPITRQGGELHVPLRLLYDTATAAAAQPVDPARWTVTITDGPLPDRILRRTAE